MEPDRTQSKKKVDQFLNRLEAPVRYCSLERDRNRLAEVLRIPAGCFCFSPLPGGYTLIAMLAKKLLLLTVMVAGMYAKPAVRSTDDSGKIDDGTLAEVKTEDEEVVTSVLNDATAENTLGSTTAKPGLLAWFLAPLTQNIQFSPQSLLRDRIANLKETLGSLNVQGREDAEGKQLSAANGLLQIAGPSDSGFYTNRLEPAGFFGGNGWLANKGGILGGPGAILSTGSLLTDYPTPYRRK